MITIIIGDTAQDVLAKYVQCKPGGELISWPEIVRSGDGVWLPRCDKDVRQFIEDLFARDGDGDVVVLTVHHQAVESAKHTFDEGQLRDAVVIIHATPATEKS